VSSCNSTPKDEQHEVSKKLRVVSLAPSITKELLALGLKDNIVGATSYCSVSKEDKDLIVGTAITVNIEKLLLLEPDIVFASSLTKENNIHALKENGLKVYRVPKMKSFEDICSEFISISKRVGKEEIAVSIVNKAKKEVSQIKENIPKLENPPTVFIQIGVKPIFAVIPNSFMDEYITFAGCQNLAHDFTVGTVTRESIVLRNPDYIFIASMGIVAEQEKKVWEKYPDIKAVKNKKVYVIDSNKACTPSVRAFVESFKIITNKIYNK